VVVRRLLVSALLLAATPILADSPAGPGLTFSGTVRHHGRPVAGATVWLMQAFALDERPGPTPQTTTDAQGRFALTYPPGEHGRQRCVVARDAQGCLGWLEFYWDAELHLEPALRVELSDVGDARGRLTDAAGAPLPRVPVQALSLNLARASDESGRAFNLPPALANEYATVAGDDGSFVLRGVLVGGSVGAKVTVPGHGGNINVVWDQDRPCELRLERAGTVRVRFDGATDLKQLAGFKLHLYRQPGSNDPVRLYASQEATAGADRELVIADVCPGRYQLVPRLTPGVPYIPEQPPEFDVQSGTVTDVLVPLSRAAHVRGRVIDRKTGRGIAGVNVGVTAPTGRGYHAVHSWTTTDAEGRYGSYGRPGEVGVSVMQPLPPDHVPPTGDAAPPVRLAAGADHTFPDLILEPTATAAGEVVDGAGRPLAGVAVRTAHDVALPSVLTPTLTDATGHFTLRHLDPADFTMLWARTATAVTERPVQLEPAKQQGPVKLVLTEAAAFRLRGQIVDATRKPVADAAVRVEWRYPGVGKHSRMGYGDYLGTYRTDADGRFETLALWPGDQYRVHVTADGFGPAESGLVRGEAGKTHDIGAVALQRTGAVVAGRIVDAAGKPLAGVKVFNDGDASRPLATTTDAAGRFRLEGFFDGPVYVFARRDGYRFTPFRTTADGPAITITMPSADAPPPAEQPIARPPDHEAAERKLTRHLLERLWSLPRSVTGGFEGRVLEGMARVDLEQARRWLADERRNAAPGAKVNENWAPNRYVRIAEAERAADDDADDALAQLGPLAPTHAVPVLLRLAERFRATDAPKALRFAEEAVPRARAIDIPDRLWMLAEANDLLAHLGRPAEGRKLLFETADAADKVGGERMHGYARGRVAVSVAKYDPDRAKALIQPIAAEHERSRWTANVAVRLAEHDTDGALALVKELQSDRSFIIPRTHMRIAARLAERDPAAAAKLAGEITEPVHRAAALVAVAVRVGRRDPALARSLTDRCFDKYLDRP
jgi:hypothetical protein